MAPNVGLNLAINAVKNGMKREDAAKMYNVELQELNNAIMRELLPNLETAQQQTEHTVKIDKSKLKQLMANIKKHPDGANVISSKVPVYRKTEDGYEIEMPNGEMCTSVNKESFELEIVGLNFTAKLTTKQLKELKKDPAKFLKEHPELKSQLGL